MMAARMIWVGLALSLVVHAASYLGLGALPAAPEREEKDLVELAIVETPAEPEPAIEPAPPEPEPTPEAEPEPVKPPPPPKVERAPKPPKTPPPPADKTPPAAAEETVADFSGTTLTGSGGWSSAVGSGAPMNSPIGSATGTNTGRNRAGVAGGVIGGTGVRVVPEGDLSRRPKAPDADQLNAALERNYPKAARQQGIEGVARIRIRVLATGKLQLLGSLSETYAGFSKACMESLRDVSFQPGLDQGGQPVATDIAYSCRFTVE